MMIPKYIFILDLSSNCFLTFEFAIEYFALQYVWLVIELLVTDFAEKVVISVYILEISLAI